MSKSIAKRKDKLIVVKIVGYGEKQLHVDVLNIYMAVPTFEGRSSININNAHRCRTLRREVTSRRQ